MKGESTPIRGIVKGRVSNSENGNLQFPVKIDVHIFTDRWYSQGITELIAPGNWEVFVNYGGSHHTIKATLKDANDQEIEAQVRNVTLIQ